MPQYKVISACRSVKDRTVIIRTQADFHREAAIAQQSKTYFEESERNQMRKVDKQKTFNALTSTTSYGGDT